MKLPRFSIKNSQDFQSYLLPPHHLIHNPHITLNNLQDLRADIFIDIIRHRDAVLTILAKIYSSIYCLQELFSSMPAMMKSALSMASGLSVLVRMQTAGKGWPTLVKNDDSSGRVPESETTANAFICRQL